MEEEKQRKLKKEKEINEILNKSYIDKDNKKNIIIISHSKNKSEDLKYNFKTDLIINTTKIKNSSKKKSEKSKNNRLINFKKSFILNNTIKNIKADNNNINKTKTQIKMNSKLIKYSNSNIQKNILQL